MNFLLGENYLIYCKNVNVTEEKIKAYFEKDNVKVIYDYKNFSESKFANDNRLTAILIPNIEKVNIFDFNMIIEIASRGIKGLSIIGICQEKKLKHFDLSNFNKIYL